jgi:hypothetical protein
MDEILPGIWHWITPNPNIGDTLVSSYWLEASGVLIDPLLSDQIDLDWLAGRPTPPTAVVLANRHHYRDSGRIHERFGCQVHVPSAGLHDFSDRAHVVGYDPGDELPGGLSAFVVGSLSPDEDGLFLASASAIWIGDTLVRSMTDPDGRIGWVPDSLMDDPDETKAGLLEAFSEVLTDYEFEHLLLAHGLPLIGDGRAELELLVGEGGRTAPNAF